MQRHVRGTTAPLRSAFFAAVWGAIGGGLLALGAACANHSVVHVTVNARESCDPADCEGGTALSIESPGRKPDRSPPLFPSVPGPAEVRVTIQHENPFCYGHTPSNTSVPYTVPTGIAGQAALLEDHLSQTLQDLLGEDAGPPPALETTTAVTTIQRDLLLLQQTVNNNEQEVAKIWALCGSNGPEDFAQQLNIARGVRGCFNPPSIRTSTDLFCAHSVLISSIYDAIDDNLSALATSKDPNGPKNATTLATTRASVATAVSTMQTHVLAVIALIPAAERAQKEGDVLPPLQFDSNQTVTIAVNQTRLQNGLATPAPASSGASPATASQAQSLGSVSFHTLSPLYVDVGIGPAYIHDNTLAWSVVPSPGAPPGAPGTVTRTTDQTTFDGVVTISPYYAPRYMNDSLRPYCSEHCSAGTWVARYLPRPMLGLSVKAPLSSFYFGGQLDIFQFIDISAGGYVYSRPVLLGVQEGQVIGGTSVPVQNATTLTWFVSVSSSINIFSSWISTAAKAF